MTNSGPSSSETGLDAAEAAKVRLRADLKLAMRARATPDVGVLRALIAALDNAQAVPIGDTHQRYVEHQFGDRSAEVPRLGLDGAEVRRLLDHEVTSRTEAADQIERLGRSERAVQLRAEAAIVARYLTS